MTGEKRQKDMKMINNKYDKQEKRGKKKKHT